MDEENSQKVFRTMLMTQNINDVTFVSDIWELLNKKKTAAQTQFIRFKMYTKYRKKYVSTKHSRFIYTLATPRFDPRI